MISSVTLTQGALRMAREQVIVKHLPAIQNFGSIDILCSDKTGTLTTRRDAVRSGARSDRRGVAAAVDAGLHQQPLRDRHPQPARRGDSSAGRASTSRATGRSTRSRSTSSAAACRSSWRRRTAAAAGCSSPKARRSRSSTLSTAFEAGGQVAPLDAATQAGVRGGPRALERGRPARPGGRVPLARAARRLLARRRGRSRAGRLRQLRRSGPAGCRRGAGGARARRRHGEDPDRRQRAGRASRLPSDRRSTISRSSPATRSRGLDDAALGHVAEQASVFARVSPAQKNRIILALKRRGHVVGFMGDGINDAPSLHAADVGISVMTAADVAREAADIILGQPSLRVLHRGILEGRRASGNMMKYLLMGTSSNFGNMFSMAAASVFLPFLPMLPTQILLNNFLYDLAQITIPDRQRRRRLPAAAAALGHAGHSRLHAVHRADQLDLRLPDVLRAAALLPRERAAVSHGLVRRIAGDADARALRHPHDGQSVPEPARAGR